MRWSSFKQNRKDIILSMKGALKHIKHGPSRGIYEAYSRLFHGKPNLILDEDWDNMIILDACRFDTFCKINWLDGKLESRISIGSVTGQFLLRNFPNTYPDIVFIAGNPHASRLIPDRFHAFIPAWQSHWDEKLGTVPPDLMSEAVCEASDKYPNKRIFAHFVQPHQPYIGPKALEKFGTEYSNGLRVAREMAESNESRGTPYTTTMDRYRSGEISRDEVVKAYEENLEIGLEAVNRLVSQLSGKTVISSDHGEMFGEFAWPFPTRRIGHWNNIRTTELIKVPWFELPYENRKKISKGTIQESDAVSDKEQIRKLRSLGYFV